MKYLLVLFILFSQIPESHAIDWGKLKEKSRPRIQRILGISLTNKLLGKKPDTITLPEIPIVTKDATSTESYKERSFESTLFKKSSKAQIRTFNFNYINELYLSVIERNVTDSEQSNWINALEQGGSRDGIYRALVLGGEYLERERARSHSSKSVINFTKAFMGKYLNRKPSAAALKQLNTYSLKRVAVETSLEVLDAFSTEMDLLRWYAVFSADMASSFPNYLSGSLRKNKDPKYHLHWAKSVPYGHIQSEVIIKLHTIYNSLEKEL
ncbi:MAG: hypothetical protein HOE90_19610 [Bacteriovoracaceae bacterium]|nr:hypothetical protein [Bacteriovoracaceae bacterium]